jgi:hypothetical protein
MLTFNRLLREAFLSGNNKQEFSLFSDYERLGKNFWL